MPLAERGLVSPTVSVAGLLTGAPVDIGGTSPITLADYAEEIVASGLPVLRGLPAGSRPDTLDGYLDHGVVQPDP